MKFKIGDKVEIVSAKYDCLKHTIGRKVTIKSINPSTKYGVIENHYGIGDLYIVFEDDLKLL